MSEDIRHLAFRRCTLRPLRESPSETAARPVAYAPSELVIGDDGTVARDDLSLRSARDGGGEVGAAGVGSAGGPVRTRSGRQHRPRLCFHVDWHACADDVELRSATAASTTADGQPTAGVGAATEGSDARAVATVAILRLHHDAVKAAILTANHPPEALAGARALAAMISHARRRLQSPPQAPFQQGEAVGPLRVWGQSPAICDGEPTRAQ